MSIDRWFAFADQVLARVRATQTEAIRRAARLIADAAQAGDGLHIYDTGHCSHEPLHRAGGLLMMKPFRFSLGLESTPAPRRADTAAQRRRTSRGPTDEALADLALSRSALAPGDVLIVNSVSGKAPAVVQVALAAKQLGASVVAITNVTYSRAVPSEHSSGQRLCDVADVVIDNCGAVGDAALDVEGVDAKVAPTSGLTFCYIIWALVSEAVAQMAARGLKPHIYMSVNLPEGADFNARAEAEYRNTAV
jgi:uncharacterized phosphosugar-binding protein